MKRQISSYKGKKLCLWQKLLLSAVLAGAVTFAGLFGAVLYGSYDHIQGDPRAMVVLGCQVMPDGEPSILLRDRLDRALDYLEDHPDLTVVVSGGQGDNEPVTEARCMADYLMERGVEEDQLLLEERSHNTDQNLRYSRELLEAEGCDLSQGVVVVSNGFHLTRARMLAERAGYDSVSTLAAPSSHPALPAAHVCAGAAGPGQVVFPGPVRGRGRGGSCGSDHHSEYAGGGVCDAEGPPL